jgi:cytidine deaminase
MSVAGDRRDLRLNPKVYEKAVGLLRNNSEFTVAASLRQEESNVGTIVSFAHGTNRLVAERDTVGKALVASVLIYNY